MAFESICDEAKYITGEERLKMYGHPKKNFDDIAKLWEAYLGIKITNKDVALLMVLFKIAREKAGHKRDNIVDGIGYFRNAAQIEDLE